MLRAVVLLALVSIVGAVIAILALNRSGEELPTVVVDEQRGVLHGVRFGDRLAAVIGRRGPPIDDKPGFFPEGAEFTGPPSIPNPRSDRNVAPTPLHYDNSAYLVSASAGVFAMATLEGGARTLAGVGVGDELDRVREHYERVRCGEAVAGETIFGGDPPTYRWCQALLDRTGVFFGGDPIESITLLPRRLRSRQPRG